MWKFEVFKDDNGGWRWRLIQSNTLIVVESPESFVRRADAKAAAEATRAAIGASVIAIL